MPSLKAVRCAAASSSETGKSSVSPPAVGVARTSEMASGSVPDSPQVIVTVQVTDHGEVV